MLAPVIFKRKLGEIRFMSYLLFVCVIMFIVLAGIDLYDDSDYART